MADHGIPIVSIVAYSNTGKTTFLEKLIPELNRRGLKVAVVKHDGHDFEIDKEGKDSYRITKAGAAVTGLVSRSKAVLMENRPRSIDEILACVKDVDLILTEGYKTEDWPKIMLHRQATGKPLPLEPGKCMAVVSDVPVEGASHLYDLNDTNGVADLLMEMMQDGNVSKNCLYEIPFLETVKTKTLDLLWKSGKVEKVKKGTILFHAKKDMDKIFIQLSGKSAVYNLTHQGQRKVIFVFGKGVLLNDHVMNEHFPSTYCETIEQSMVFSIPTQRFLALMENDFSLTKSVIKMQEWKMWRMGHQLKNTTGSIYMERKLAAKLWKLARDFGKIVPEGIEIDLNLSITFLSDMLGAPRETTSRLCKTLVDYGLMKMNKKRIIITDADNMSRLYREGTIE